LNFVPIVSLQAGTRLIPLESWEERSEDREWPPYRPDLPIRTNAPTGQIEAVRIEIGCARIRPEDVAGACLEGELPASFTRCRDDRRAIVHVLDHGAARPGSGAAGSMEGGGRDSRISATVGDPAPIPPEARGPSPSRRTRIARTRPGRQRPGERKAQSGAEQDGVGTGGSASDRPVGSTPTGDRGVKNFWRFFLPVMTRFTSRNR
jgi:hypothetical protein